MKSFFLILSLVYGCDALLFPQHNEHRSITSLDGIWTFVREPSNSEGIGIKEEWFKRDLHQFSNATVMPVPSAYNELGAGNDGLRNHVGWVWYQTQCYVGPHNQNKSNVLRFGSVQYYAQVYLNGDLRVAKSPGNDGDITFATLGDLLGSHAGGHLPFEFPVNFKTDAENVITVGVNNTLSHATVPQAEFHTSGNFTKNSPYFDFFNYAGILRSVQLLALPVVFIEDLVIKAFHNGTIQYAITLNNQLMPEQEIRVSILDASGQNVEKMIGLKNTKTLKHVKSWWPRDMGNPYLYTLEAILFDVSTQKSIDVYREPFGFRTVTVDSNHIYINGKPFYCKGFGAHEDSALHGRGYDPVVMVKDLNMLEWMNANCYRTSHYPYSEQRAYEADRRGIAVITEVPAVALRHFDDHILKLHRQMVIDTYYRDKNHPSTIIWSLANEPTSDKKVTKDYFANVAALARKLDDTRLITVVVDVHSESDHASQHVDVIFFNRYYGWYQDTADLGKIKHDYIAEIRGWHERFNKPVVLSEYGAECIPGFSSAAGEIYSYQYQIEVHEQVHAALDVIRAEGYGAGEMIWNFADFETYTSITRPFGNHKGVLDRNRQPKPVAYLAKERYGSLAPLIA